MPQKPIVAVVAASLLIIARHSYSQTPLPGGKTVPATTVAQPVISIGGYAGFSMAVSSPEYLYNYGDYAPPGLGLRYGMCGMVQAKAARVNRADPDFSVVGEVRYATLFHGSDFTGSPPTSTSAVFELLSVGIGLEQAIPTGGDAAPYFGLTLDVNAVAPGSLTITTKDSLNNQTANIYNLTGNVWQLRFGVTPRIGVITRLAHNLSLDIALHYQVINLANRADHTPKNFLLDPFGKEPLLSQMNAFVGVLWTLPTRGK